MDRQGPGSGFGHDAARQAASCTSIDRSHVRRASALRPADARDLLPQIGRISISDGTGIGLGQRLTQATASSMEGSSQSQ
jgi:hypothetical protein